MTRTIQTYGSHIRCWTYTLTTVFVFGALLGSVGIARIQNLPTLTLIDSNTKTMIVTHVDSNTGRIVSLEKRVTDIEHKQAAVRMR